jgi:crossover junction endodeoxyribonuclease RuvC
MVVLGIDPGTKRTGYAVIESVGEMILVRNSGALATSPRSPFHERLRTIYDGLVDIVTTYRPDEIAVEDVFVKKNARVALRMGHVRGVALLVAAIHELKIGEYSPGEIKQAVVGTGSASKEQVKFMVTALLRLTEAPSEDEADALAVALCHVHRRRLSEDSPLDILHKRYSC